MVESKKVSKSFNVLDRRTGVAGMIKDAIFPRKTERKVLRGISCIFEEGDRVCVAGRNGTGKSTLLKIIAGVMRPSSGSVLYNGGEVRIHQKNTSGNSAWFLGKEANLCGNYHLLNHCIS